MVDSHQSLQELILFRDSHNLVTLSEAAPQGKEWDVVLIETGLSKNGNFYPADVLRKSVPLFEGLKACAYRFGKPLGDQFNHLPEKVSLTRPDGLAENVVGWFANARYAKFTRRDGTKGEGIVALFHVMEGADWLRKNLKDSFDHGMSDILGFSIDAKGKARDQIMGGKTVRVVERLEEVRSTDVVSSPAAGGAILRLVASCEVNMDKIQEASKLGDFLQSEAEKKGVSVAQLGRAAGISASTVTQIMRGEITRPPDQRLRGFARVLQVSFDRLLNLIPEEARESVNGAKDDFEEAIKIVKEGRPGWLNGMDKSGDESSKDYALRVLEANHAQAQEVQNSLDVNSKEFKEVARGVSTLNRIVAMLRDGKAGDAVKLIQDLVAVSESGADSLYSFPDGAISPEQSKNKEQEKEDGMENEKEVEKIEEMKKREDALAVRETAMAVKERVGASDLPDKAKIRLSGILASKVGITEEEIDKAIGEEREYISSLSEEKPTETKPKEQNLDGSQDDQVDVKVVQEHEQKLEKAWDGFWANQDVDGVKRFYGLREAFVAHNGNVWIEPRKMARLTFQALKFSLPGFEAETDEDYDNHRNWLKESWAPMIKSRYHFKEATTTASFPVAFGDSLFRRLQKEFAMDPRNDWRMVVSSVENLTDATNVFRVQRVGDIEDWPTVNENAPYQELGKTLTEQNTDLTPAKKGGLFKVSWEAILADRVGTIRRIPRQLAISANRTVQKAVFNEIESNVSVAGNALISGANNNNTATDPTLSYAAVTDTIQLLRDQTSQDAGEKLGLAPWRLLVGTKLENEAHEITDSKVKVTSSEDSTVVNHVARLGVQTLSTLGLGRTATTDDHFWVMVNPREAETIVIGFLGGRDRPDIFVQGMETPTSGSFFDADTITFKGRIVFGVSTPDFRWIAGSLK